MASKGVSDSVTFTMADFHVVPPAATRSRDEALALVTELARRAPRAAQRFAELVREHGGRAARWSRNSASGPAFRQLV
jgi:hypothetical protein